MPVDLIAAARSPETTVGGSCRHNAEEIDGRQRAGHAGGHHSRGDRGPAAAAAQTRGTPLTVRFSTNSQSRDALSSPQLVHRQFNSPLGLYSNESVQEVVAQQSGLIP